MGLPNNASMVFSERSRFSDARYIEAGNASDVDVERIIAGIVGGS